MTAKDYLEEIDYYDTNVVGELYEDLGIELLSDILEKYHERKLNLLTIPVVVGQSGQLCEGLHNTDFSGKCFKCGEQVFVREDKA